MFDRGYQQRVHDFVHGGRQTQRRVWLRMMSHSDLKVIANDAIVDSIQCKVHSNYN